MSKKAEKLLKQIIFIGSALILFLPLFVYRGVMYPYIFSKIIVFRILVEIIFIAWLFLAIYSKRYRPNFKNPLVLSLTIFVGVLFLTAVLGVDFHRSFWSTQERMTGVLTIFHFWAWFLILTSTFSAQGGSTTDEQNWKYWRAFIYISLLSSLLIGLYGIGQKLEVGFLIKNSQERMSSLLGNPIFLGVYSLLHIFLAIFLFFKEQSKPLKILNIFLAVFNFLVMSLTDSRTVTIVFMVSFVLFLVSLVFSLSSKKWRKITGFIIFFVLLAIVSCFIFFQTPTGLAFLDRLPSIVGRVFYLKALFSSVEQRLAPWQIGLRGFLERPIFGWGWENFNIPFNKNFFPELSRTGVSGTWYDKSHNQVIDLLTLTGILGVLAYLVMYGSTFWLLLKKKTTPKQGYSRNARIGIVILMLMFLAYFVQNLTVFDTPAPLIMFYFGLGLVYFMTSTNFQINSDDTNNKSNSKPKTQISKPKQLPLPILVFLIAIFLPWAMYKFNIEPWQQSSLGVRAVQASQRDSGIGLKFYKEALAKENIFTNPEIRSFLAQTAAEQKKEDKNFKEGLLFAIAEMEKNTKEQPLDARHWLNLGQLYNAIGQDEKEYLEKAELVLNRARDLSSRRQTIYFELVKTEALAQKFNKAIQLAKEAVELDPQVVESYKVLAIACVAGNKIEEGILALNKARESMDIYSDSSFALFVSTTYFKFGDIAKAIEVAEICVRNYYPKDVSFYTHLAALYKEAGEKEKAIETVRKAVELSPSLASEAEAFIGTLK